MVSTIFRRGATAGMTVADAVRAWHPHYARHLGMALKLRYHELRIRTDLPRLEQMAREPRNHRRFAIVGGRRSGSTLLRRMLDAQSDVRCFGEILAKFAWESETGFTSQFDAAVAIEDATRMGRVRVMDEVVWPREAPFGAIGFKLHDRDGWGRQAEMRHYVLAVPDLHVVRLRRRDLLAQAVSEMRSSRDKVWNAAPGVAYEPEPLVVDTGVLVARMKARRSNAAQLDREFAGRPTVEVWYEDVAADPLAELRRVADFLGVEVDDEDVPLRKVSSGELRQDVANFDAVVKALRGTELEEFLRPHL